MAEPLLIGMLHDHGGGFDNDTVERCIRLAVRRAHRAGQHRPPARARARGGRGPAAWQRVGGGARLRRARRTRRAGGDRSRGERQRAGGARPGRRRRAAHAQLHRIRGHPRPVRVPLPDRLARGGALRAGASPAGRRAPVGGAGARRVAHRPPLHVVLRRCVRDVRGGAARPHRRAAARRGPPRPSGPPSPGAAPTRSSTSGSASPPTRSASALGAAGSSLPVFANSALMFGYANPSWTADWEGWVYCDTVSESNDELRRVGETLGLGDSRRQPRCARQLRHGPPARRGHLARTDPDTRRPPRGPRACEDAPGRERAGRHHHGLRPLRAQRAQGPLPGPPRVARRDVGRGPDVLHASPDSGAVDRQQVGFGGQFRLVVR